jgi:dTMP kinase
MFYSFDGMDGGGKTTQMRLFCDWLQERGPEVVVCRDPGGTRLGEEIRKLLLHRDDLNPSRRAEMLLYMAARAQLVEEIIVPALEAGKTIVSDRFLLANVVYQGHAGGLDVPSVWQVGRIATGGLEPELTFVLDLDERQAAARLNRPLDRMERQGDAFRAALRTGYLVEAARRPDKIVVIDASGSIDEVQAEIRNTIDGRRGEN